MISTGSEADVLDFGALERATEALRSEYETATPFPHVVFDGALTQHAFEQACTEFPTVDNGSWTSYTHVNERKYGNTDPNSWGPTLHAIARALTSTRFLALVEQITGESALLADWSMDGGGLHQSFSGGYLNLHADFTAHHTNSNWRRRINALLYLNETWESTWGGDLELWDADRTRCEASIAPIGNRLVLFETTESSYHGHPEPMKCPDHVGRKSMALYYFLEQDRPLTRSTDYRARPGDGVKAVPIYLDRQMLRGYDIAKRRLHLPDDIASRVLARLSRSRPRGRER